MKYIIFFIFIILLLLLINYLYMHTAYYRNLCVFENRIGKASEIPSELQMINLGSGFARFSFSYDNTNIKGYNFAQSPQCLEYDFKILKEFSSKLAEGCIVCINLPIFIFCFYRYKEFKYNIKYYSCLNKKEIDNYSYLKYLIATKFPIFVAGKSIFHILMIKKDISRLELYNCKFNQSEIERMVDEHYNAWTVQFQLENTTSEEVCAHLKPVMEDITKLLKELIDYCLDNNWNPILVSTPLCGKLNDKFSDEFLNEVLYKNIKKSNVKNIPYIDLRKEESFGENHDFFWNGVDWLSKSGREYFVKLLMKMIVEEGYDKDGILGSDVEN